MSDGAALRIRAQQWLEDDPDPVTAAALAALLADDDLAGLAAAFGAPLAFGTAGLRGPIGPGPAAMNVAVVRRTAAAIAAWLADDGAAGPVVVGFDARHRSADFAAAVAGVIAGAGRDVVVSAGPIPTPLLAFAARHLGAAAACMVTASHNPPGDNGLKVYGGDGRQIVTPTDAAIAARMADVERVSDLPLAAPDSPRWTALAPAVTDAYLAGVAAMRTDPDAAPLVVAYTPMHGVGGALLADAFARAGLPVPTIVATQAAPDPDFPTVAFPNPEEPGAMDAVLALGAAVNADLVLANDPDADRLGVAVPDAGRWRVLTGDEIGVLLADHLLLQGAGDDRLVASSVVSSTMLASVAAAHGAVHVETLTGFKWLSRASAGRPERCVLAYEEALGYCIGDLVRDKDGISAAVVFTELAGSLVSAGSSVPERLATLAVTHGLHRTAQRSMRFPGGDGAGAMAAAVERLRRDPPDVVASAAVTEVEDLARGERLPPTDAVILRGEGWRVIVRPSGTEPKLKLYGQVVVPVASVDAVPEVRAGADVRLGAVLDDVARRITGP